MKNAILPQLVALVISILISQSAFAFRLEPMNANFTPEGENATKIFRVENEGQEKIAAKIQTYVRTIDENGKESLKPSSDFKVYPEQLTLAANDSRSVRVVYIGKKELEQEASYRLIASQLPVDFKNSPKKSGINFLFQFVASVYVTNEKYYPKIEVESATRSKKNPDTVRLKIINRGQKHVLLKNVDIEMTDTAGKKILLSSSLIENWDGENMLSGSRRVFNFKTNSDFDLKKNPPKITLKDEI